MKFYLADKRLIMMAIMQLLPIILFSQNQYSARVIQPDPISTPSICIVSVADNKNIVVWDKSTNDFTSYYKIYRESTQQTGKWDSIGFVLSSKGSVFVDSTSEPSKQSYRYKISSVDKCGNETTLSSSHKTMNLSILKSINNTYSLIWDEYEGFLVSSYRIYRGTTKNDLKLIGSTTAGNFNYNDSYSPVDAIYYQVEVLAANDCNAGNLKSTTAYNSSRSNIASNIATSLNSFAIDQDIKINPNPFSYKTTISLLTFNNENYTLSVYDLTGKKVKTERFVGNQYTFYKGVLSDGLYYIELSSKTKTFRKKITIVK